MENFKNFYQNMFVYYSLLIPQHNLDFVMLTIQLPIVHKFNQNVVVSCFHSIWNIPINQALFAQALFSSLKLKQSKMFFILLL
jgi:hypothetical protein